MTPRVAIVHDYLTQRGGAERVVLSMARAFPGAPVHTALYEPRATYPEFARLDVRPSVLDRVGSLRRHHRLALPLLAPTMAAMRVDADVLLCSSSGWAHGVGGDQPRVVYCHAPARWLHQRDRYLGTPRRGRRVEALALAVLGTPLRAWDRRAVARATRYLTNSTYGAALVRAAYGIDAEVVAPPVSVDVTGAQRALPGVEPGFVLCVSRLLPYKHVGAVAAAFADLPDERLLVIGAGPQRRDLEAAARPNVEFVGAVDDAELRWAYANASLLVAAAHEDFGLTPLEANAFGVPVAALRFGGYLDTVEEGVTGVYFETPTPPAVAGAVVAARATTFDPDHLRAHAATFSEDRFAARLQDIVGEVTRAPR